jgi:hypothetical protein
MTRRRREWAAVGRRRAQGGYYHITHDLAGVQRRVCVCVGVGLLKGQVERRIGEW